MFALLRQSCLLLALVVLFAPLSQADWNRFRGPNGSGVAQGEAPAEWSETENLAWKVELPGAGVSSPIVVGGKVFVTCYSGYGVSREDVGDIDELTRHLVCLDAKSGDVLWTKDVPNEVEEDAYQGMGIPAHGYASHTPTSDGEHVYAFFGKTGVVAFDMEGNEQWRKMIGTGSDPRRWGSSSSPIVHNDVLIVTAGPEARAIIGLNKNTGEELWRADAEGLGNVWGTPAIAKAGEYEDVVIGAPYEIWGLNPNNGKLSWFCEAVESDSFNTSLVVANETVYAIEGRRGGGGSVAIKAGGTDDVSDKNVVWSTRNGGGFATPVIYEGRIYQFASGIFSCLDAETGEEIFKSRLPSSSGAEDRGGRGGFGGERGGGRGGFGGFGGGGMDYPSPVVAANYVYYLRGSGEMLVFKTGTDEMEHVATNKVTNEAESFGATPAISDGRIYLRSNKHLYCISAE